MAIASSPDASTPEASRRPVRRAGGRSVGRVLARAAGVTALLAYPVVVLVVLWQLRVESSGDPPLVLPPPSRVWESLVELTSDGVLVEDAITTITRISWAFLLAMLVGVPAGLASARNRWVRAALRPVAGFLFPTPKITLYPALLIALGLGSASKIGMGFLEALFPIFLATQAAAANADDRLLWAAESLGMPRRQLWYRILLPAALPGILSGARIGVVAATLGTFFAELVVSTDGLGNLMASSWRQLQTWDMYAALIAMAVVALVIDRLFLAVRAWLLRWTDEA